MIDAPIIGLVTIAAAFDAINPYAIEVLLFTIAKMLGRRASLVKIFWSIILYALAFTGTYLIIGLALLKLLLVLPSGFKHFLLITIALLATFYGALFIKKFFWPQKDMFTKFPDNFTRRIQCLAHQHNKLTAILLLGVYMAIVELVCTGLPYLATLSALSFSYQPSSLWVLMFYNLIIILPMLFIALVISFGAKISTMHKWTDEARDILRLISGLIIISLGWILILIANGVISLD